MTEDDISKAKEIEARIEEFKAEIEKKCVETGITRREAMSLLSKAFEDIIAKNKDFSLDALTADLKMPRIKINKNLYVFYLRDEGDLDVGIWLRESKVFDYNLGKYAYCLPAKDCINEKSIKELSKRIILPKYSIEKALDSYSETESKKRKFKELSQRLKDLNLKTNSCDVQNQEEFTFTKDDVHTLNLFFRFLNNDEEFKFLTALRNEWKFNNEMPLRIIRKYAICSIFFPNNVELKLLRNAINSLENKSYEAIDKILSSISFHFTTNKPLLLALDEVYFTLKSLFNLDINRETIQNYCKEMYLKFRPQGSGNKIDYINFNHPYFDEKTKERFIALAKEEKKALSF